MLFFPVTGAEWRLCAPVDLYKGWNHSCIATLSSRLEIRRGTHEPAKFVRRGASPTLNFHSLSLYAPNSFSFNPDCCYSYI